MLVHVNSMRIRLLAVLMTLSCCAGPVLAQAAVPAGTVPPPPATAASAETPHTSPVPANYIIGPGDTLQVFVWRNPELAATIPVRPDGKISTPLVEDMVAVGKNPSALARDIEKV